MQTYEIRNSEGQLIAFEVPNLLLSRKKISEIISRIPNVEITRKPKFFSSLCEEEFCEFKIENSGYIVWEPFGDSSRYHIACSTKGSGDDIGYLKKYFDEL